MKILLIYSKYGNFSCLLDDIDYEWAIQFKWHISFSSKKIVYVKRGRLYMHRLICQRILGDKFNENLVVDHKDRNTFNNQRNNLRQVSDRESMLNRNISKRLCSEFKGPQYDLRSKKWSVRIRDKDGKRRYIGSFEEEIDAVLAYEVYAREIYGPYYVPNVSNIKPDEEEYIRELVENGLSRRKTHTSRFKGVYFDKQKERFAAYVYYAPGKKTYAGFFNTEEEAAKAYNMKATELLGDKAILNSI